MWRDPDPNAGRKRDTAPTGILFSANFGIAPYELTNSLAETAEMFGTLDRANLGLVFRAERPWRLPTGFANAQAIRSIKEPASFSALAGKGASWRPPTLPCRSIGLRRETVRCVSTSKADCRDATIRDATIMVPQ